MNRTPEAASCKQIGLLYTRSAKIFHFQLIQNEEVDLLTTREAWA